MTVFGTEMLLVTFLFVLVECVFFVQQLIFYLQRPSEKKRLYYLNLLGLLIVYNIAGGIFPDPNLPISLILQRNIDYGTGFFMGAFFPFYFYKAYEMEELSWQARYGVWIFFIAPFVLFFCILSPLFEDMPSILWYGLAIPLVYAFFLVYKILSAIRKKFGRNKNSLEAILTYAAMCPSALLPLFSYVNASQLLEVICINCGFIIITFLFFKRLIHENRKAFEKLSTFDKDLELDSIKFFVKRCAELGLTKREIEIVELVSKGLTSKEIAEKIFISDRTVNKHLQSIFRKSETKNRVELVNVLKIHS